MTTTDRLPTAVAAGALLGAVLLGWLAGTQGAIFGVFAVGLATSGLAIVMRPTIALPTAIALVLCVSPYQVLGSDVLTPIRLGAILALATLIAARPVVPRLTDIAIGGLALLTVMTPFVHSNGLSLQDALTPALPLVFYPVLRLVKPGHDDLTIHRVILGAALVGALSVILDLALGRPFFGTGVGGTYDFEAISGLSLFRPQGVFSSPPAAAIGLSMMLLLSIPPLRNMRRALALISLLLIGVAVASTLGRAGWLGLIAGGIAYWVLTGPTARQVFPAVLIIVVGILGAFLVANSAEDSDLVQYGILRTETAESRFTLFDEGASILKDSPATLLLGQGAGTFYAINNRRAISVDPSLLRASFVIERGGPHSLYLMTLLELGIIGLALLLLWLGSALTSSFRRRQCPYPRSAFAALVCFSVASLLHDNSLAPQVFLVATVATYLALAQRPVRRNTN